MKYNVNEVQINPADSKAVFKTATTPSGLGKIFKSLRNDKVSFDDLVAAWNDAGQPDDTAEIADILKDHGFGNREIKKIFSKVFGKEKTDAGYQEPTQSATVQKIANYAKEHGLVDELKSFLQKEYNISESANYFGKLAVKDVGDVFTHIINEERSGRDIRLKEQEQKYLGRSRK